MYAVPRIKLAALTAQIAATAPNPIPAFGVETAEIGLFVGALEGLVVGEVVGCVVGAIVGLFVGVEEGLVLGAEVGLEVGSRVTVGAIVGLTVGAELGRSVGLAEGFEVGLEEGFSVEIHSKTRAYPTRDALRWIAPTASTFPSSFMETDHPKLSPKAFCVALPSISSPRCTKLVPLK